MTLPLPGLAEPCDHCGGHGTVVDTAVADGVLCVDCHDDLLHEAGCCPDCGGDDPADQAGSVELDVCWYTRPAGRGVVTAEIVDGLL